MKSKGKINKIKCGVYEAFLYLGQGSRKRKRFSTEREAKERGSSGHRSG